ncbi:MAG TPA: hypothetical protein DCG12_04340 [Planctomycetaceae bacterium]|nr:hypothetical protein [Planctomycetaceae bacterium]
MVAETEENLISIARDAVSQCNWVVGECAAQWTQKYARGRTDADFGQMVGLSGDQIYQRRRVWETFGKSWENYSNLKWSFFYVALNWEDATRCLNWADENEATVAEMRAWRRAQNGEDLFAEPEEAYSEWAAPLIMDTSEMPLTTVQDPSSFVPSGEGPRAGMSSEPVSASGETLTAAARDSGEYAPFRSGAASPAPAEQPAEVAVLERNEPTPEQVWKKTISMLERLNKSLTPSVLKAWDDQPEKVQVRLTAALSDVQQKLSGVV